MAEPAPTGERAADLVERIDAGDLDPDEVSIEPFVRDDDTVLTPELAERLPDETVADYNERIAEEHERELKAEQQELAADQRRAFEALESAFDDRHDDDTERVEIGDATVIVTTRLSGTVEQHLDDIRDEAQKPPEERSLTNVVDNMIAAIRGLIVGDEEPAGDPIDFQDRAVWEQYYEKHGSEGLYDIFDLISGPARERREDLESFRGERSGR